MTVLCKKIKIKIKLSPRLTKHNAMKTYWRSEGRTRCIYNLGNTLPIICAQHKWWNYKILSSFTLFQSPLNFFLEHSRTMFFLRCKKWNITNITTTILGEFPVEANIRYQNPVCWTNNICHSCFYMFPVRNLLQ